MSISFKGVYLYKLPNEISRDNIVRAAKLNINGKKDLWKTAKLNSKDSYDVLLLTGKDLVEYRALSALRPNGSLEEYSKAIANGYVQKATVFDFRK